MTPTLAPWLRRNPLPGYYIAVFFISWGGILTVVGARGFDLVHLRTVDTAIIFVAMLLGPSISGLAMTTLLDGQAGLRALRLRLMRWRVDLRWYLGALLTMSAVGNGHPAAG